MENKLKKIPHMESVLDLILNDLIIMEKILWEDVMTHSVETLSSEKDKYLSRRYFTISTAIYIEAIIVGAESASTLTRVIKRESINKKETKTMFKNIVTQIPGNRTSDNVDRRSFSDRVKNGLRSIAKVTGHTFDLSTQNFEWETFNKAIKIRDRIVHPKTPSDLLITDSELYQVITAGTWFKNNLFFVCTGKV